MANEKHLARLQQGVAAWNKWWKGRYSVLRQRYASTFQRLWETAAPAVSRVLWIMKDTSSKVLDHLCATPWQTIAYRHWKFLLGIIAVILFITIWKVPQWQAARWQGLMEPKDLAKLENDARTTLIQGVGGLILLIGLYFTLKNLQLAEDRQITERYIRAIEQLGNDKLEVRLGAIYALERIARDSARDHWPIMEILTSYIRERASWAPKGNQPPEEKQEIEDNQRRPKLAIDIQAVLTVLGRRNHTFDQEDQFLNLRRTDLRGADLQHLHLERMDLGEAHLEGVMFGQVHLEKGLLLSAYLDGAILIGTHLEGAVLFGAHLKDCMCQIAHLEGADFRDADLEGANFTHAFLKDSHNLTIEQLASVHTLYEADLDLALLEEIQQHYPHLLAGPEEYAEIW